jgi:hypothetical protein
VLAPLAGLQLLWLRVPLRRVLGRVAAAGAGTLAVLAAAVAALLLQGASPGAIADATVVYNAETQFVEAVGAARLVRTWATLHLESWWMLSVLAACGCAFAWRERARSAAATALALVWVAGVLSFAIQRRGFLYHLGPCLIPLIGLAAVAVGKAFAQGARGSRWLWAGGCVALALVFGGGAVKLRANYATLALAWRADDPAIHLRSFKRQDGLSIDEVVALARRIEREVPPDGTVLMLGTTSAVNYLAERAQPTRFFYAPVLTQLRPDMPMHGRWVAAFAEDLERSRAPLCLIRRPIYERWLAQGGAAVAVLRGALEREYVHAGSVGENRAFEIYERR